MEKETSERQGEERPQQARGAGKGLGVPERGGKSGATLVANARRSRWGAGEGSVGFEAGASLGTWLR